MKNRKRLPALLLSLALALSLCACGKTVEVDPPEGSASVSPSASPDPSAAPSLEVDLTQGALQFAAGLSPTDILLTVNGEDVQADLFCYFLDQACSQIHQYLAYYYGMSLADVPDMADSLLEQGVEWAVYHTIVRQKAAELGCLLTDDQTATVTEALDDDNVQKQALSWELTGQSLRFILEAEYGLYYANLLDAVTHEPSEQELEEYLDSQGVFSVKHILLKTVDDRMQPLSDDKVAAQKALADDLLAQLQAAEDMPAKFDELMNQYSEDGRDENGDLYSPDGYVFTNGDSLVGGFREAALELDEGRLSGIVETDYGYHIMLRLALTEEMVESYRTDIRVNALEEQIAQWTEASEITRADALSGINAVDFYVRLTAYQRKLAEENSAG